MKILESRRSEMLLQFFFALVIFEYNYKLLSLDGDKLIDLVIWFFVLPVVSCLTYKLLAYFIFKDLIYAKAALITFQTHSYCTLVLKADTVVDIFFYWLLAICSFTVIMSLYLIKLSHFCCRLANEENPNAVEVFLLKKCKDFIRS